jgi:hypothetical protein
MIRKDPKVSNKVLQSYLSGFARNPVSASTARIIKKLVQSDVYGPPAAAAQYVPSLVEALIQLGHSAEVEPTVTPKP